MAEPVGTASGKAVTARAGPRLPPPPAKDAPERGDLRPLRSGSGAWTPGPSLRAASGERLREAPAQGKGDAPQSRGCVCDGHAGTRRADTPLLAQDGRDTRTPRAVGALARAPRPPPAPPHRPGARAGLAPAALRPSCLPSRFSFSFTKLSISIIVRVLLCLPSFADLFHSLVSVCET